ncbi:MAG: ferredoxin [Ilumatobacteraceae bacterium]
MKESSGNFGTEKKFDGEGNPAGPEGRARIPDGEIESVIEAAEECPGECIFIEVE